MGSMVTVGCFAAGAAKNAVSCDKVFQCMTVADNDDTLYACAIIPFVMVIK